MSLVKCRYVTMECGPRNKTGSCVLAYVNDPYAVAYQCEWQGEDGQYVSCSCAEPIEHYLEGEYKRIKFDGETLFIGNKEIASIREKAYYGEEFEEGIHYLEIDGHVYINDDEEEEQVDAVQASSDAVHGSGESPDEEKQSDCG